MIKKGLAYARELNDRYREKLALEHLGIAYRGLADHARSFTAYEDALAVARQVGDRRHEAELLWYLATQHAELGRRDDALATGQMAIDLFSKLGNPYVGWLAESLKTYRVGGSAGPLANTSHPALSPFAAGPFGGSVLTPEMFPGSAPASGPPNSGPGLLRMALTAVKSVGRFIGSGLKTVSSATQQKRLRTCAMCEHHTGVRCQICGCFTSVKAWLPHEDCPIGKWPTDNR